MSHLACKLHSVFLRFVSLIGASIAVSGCAQNCGIFTTNASSLCHLEMGGVLVIATAMQPVVYATNVIEERKEAKAELQLREAVEMGGLAASETCLFSCASAFRALKDDRWRVRRIAAERVVKEYQSKMQNSPKEEALLMASHNAIANALWEKDRAGRLMHLNEVVRYGQSKEMWVFVEKESSAGNDLPVNEGHFKNIATSTVLALLRLRHVERIASGIPESSEIACDFSEFGKMLEYANSHSEKSLCELASSSWQREQKGKSGDG